MFTFSCPSRSKGDTQTGNKNALIRILYLTPFPGMMEVLPALKISHRGWKSIHLQFKFWEQPKTILERAKLFRDLK